jgi:peptidoglycan hydrolase-like protein with peptidoglycan-binding domain
VSKGKLAAWGAGIATLAVAVLAVVGFGGTDGATPATGSTGPAATTKITKQTLADAKTVIGQLDYGDATPLAGKATGTVTWLPAVGATIRRGGALLRADNNPVTLLYGPLPAYRPLVVGTEGPDVKQFEQNLKALGYSGFAVDEKYSASTASAVKKWQKELGRTETGMVDVAAVVYAAGPLRVEEQKVRIGAPAAGDVLTYTGTQKVVTLDVDADDHAWAVRGTSVTVTLPGKVSVTGKIEKVGNEASSDDSGNNQNGQNPGTGNATVPVTVTIADQKKLGALAKTPVDVRYVAEERKDVLTVPVAALLALAEGGYGLELVTSGGTQIVAVEAGLFADGRVEVRGPDIAEGQTVGMPS